MYPPWGIRLRSSLFIPWNRGTNVVTAEKKACTRAVRESIERDDFIIISMRANPLNKTAKI
ncbi:hypothetical protein PFAG_01887 [Plasmodium falciparum Santa Lucia]|uniref:Uncharacterized protein n=1 Tax=Plasmodium falciparum Santa Lucia TaxID=478859 RepID=W7FS41_PLAFA|nr:hypothetical protein PFAG_01887 [Plasmodium falciparum Santa Lucia]